MYCSLLRLLSNLVSTVQLTSTRLWQTGRYDTGTYYTLLAGNWASFKYDNISNFGTGIGFRRCVFPLNCIKIRQLYSQGPWLNVLVWTLSQFCTKIERFCWVFTNLHLKKEESVACVSCTKMTTFLSLVQKYHFVFTQLHLNKA